ncbi:MAG: glycoside hydrolase family 15 protein [Verrucomicrobiota bacterium]|nr:glycoside hydrolase family 15 protein [Verrucomicrobiota bacterium]
MATTRIEDYAFLSDTQTGALVSKHGCVDWLCFPRFDSPACFASLLGTKRNGHWSLRPSARLKKTSRRYLGDTLILETTFETASGVVRVLDFMPPRGEAPDLIRIVEGVRGRVRMKMELIIRFDYGHIVPWVRRRPAALEAIAGPNALLLQTPAETRGKNLSTLADFTVGQGERVPFVLTWYPSHLKAPRKVNAMRALRDTKDYWSKWSKRCQTPHPWRNAVMRSLLTLKGLTFAPSGGIVAAPTTSLPEKIGGERNWDYRFCWLRDATFTLLALMRAGYLEEARSWRQWLLRAVAGGPDQLQILYSVTGQRRLEETTLPWLKGYRNSTPVRIGNAAATQCQLDVYGEIMASMYRARVAGIKSDEADWRMQVALMQSLEKRWRQPDEGIWEVRGPRRHFTHSKMMAWVAFDCAIKLIEECGCTADHMLPGWRAVRDRIHRQVCARGYNRRVRAFTQYYGSAEVDASLLLMPLVGFLPVTDERVKNTIAAIERRLLVEGFVMRYRAGKTKVDGLSGAEGVFLPCSFWLADCLNLLGRHNEARELFECLLLLRNDVGLLAEEYDPRKKHQLGNFPQAFTHVALVNTAFNLASAERVG